MFMRHVTRYSLGVFFLVLISVFTVACGSASTNVASQPKPTATPSPTPTPTPAVSLTTYKGDGYSIGYPTGWTISNNNQQIQISDVAQDNLTIESKTGTATLNNPGAYLVQLTLAGLKAAEKNFKDIGVSSKTTIDGTTWDQGAATMTDSQAGPIQIVVVGTQNPKHPGQLIIMFYGTTQKTFDKINSADFQPMLKSFKFQP